MSTKYLQSLTGSQEIRHWANFLKHPKWFMLAIHPQWEYEGAAVNGAWDATPERVTINTTFVKEYYRHEANNHKLDRILARKEDVVVLFPNPVELMTRLRWSRHDGQKKDVYFFCHGNKIKRGVARQTA